MDIFSEISLRESFEVQRLQLLASRVMSLSGARSMVLWLDEDDSLSMLCGTGRLASLPVYVGDALLGSGDLDSPLSQLV